MKLKEIRLSKNLTQKELTNILNLKPTTYNGYEKGLSEPSIETLIKLADFYRVTLDELVGRNVPYLINKVDFSNEQLSLLEELKTLDKVQCQNVSAYIKGLKDGKIIQ